MNIKDLNTNSKSAIMTPENTGIANYLTQLEALGKSKPDNLSVRVQITSSSAEECKKLIAHYDAKPTELVDDTYSVFAFLDLDGIDLALIDYTRKLDPSEYSDEYKESQRVARLNELSEKERNVLHLLSILAKHGLDAAEGARLLKDLESVYTITPKSGETENA